MALKAPSYQLFRWIPVAFIVVIGLVYLSVPSSRIAQAQSSSAGSWLEFNVTPQEASRITGFFVGYFVPGEKIPAFVFEVPRSRVETPGAGVMRVPLIVSKLPAGKTYEVRLQTLNRRQRSGWSEPSGQFTVPADGGAPAAPPTASREAAKKPQDRQPARKQGGRSAVTELKNNPELAEKMSRQFPGVNVNEAAEGFRTVRDLGTALFLASNLKVPFTDVKRLTADQGNRDFAKAIGTLKPDADAKAEEQRALKESRQAFRAAPVKRK